MVQIILNYHSAMTSKGMLSPESSTNLKASLRLGREGGADAHLWGIRTQNRNTNPRQERKGNGLERGELEASMIMLAVTCDLSLGAPCPSAPGAPIREQPHIRTALPFHTQTDIFRIFKHNILVFLLIQIYSHSQTYFMWKLKFAPTKYYALQFSHYFTVSHFKQNHKLQVVT